MVMTNAWMGGQHEATPGVAFISPGLTIAVRCGQILGFCPIRLGNLGVNWLVRLWALILLCVQIPLCVDIAALLITKTEFLGFFTNSTVTKILHLSIALQGTLNSVVNLISTNRWKNLLQSFKQLPNGRLSPDCSKSIRNYCTCGIVLGVVAGTAYSCVLLIPMINHPPPSEKSTMRQMTNVQQFITIFALATPAFLFSLFAGHLHFHFKGMREGFLQKFHSFKVSFPATQARAFSELYFKLTTALDAMDDMFAWHVFLAVLNSIVTGAFAAYLLLMSGTSIEDQHNVHVLLLVGIQQAAFLAITVFGALLNEQSRAIGKELFHVNSERFDDTARKIMKKVRMYSQDQDWGLTVGKFFQLDRSVIITVFSVIFSHFLILIEVGVYQEEPEPVSPPS